MSSGRDPADTTRIVSRGGADVSRYEPVTDDLGTEIVSAKRDRVVGRLTVIDGPGKGESLPVYPGTNSIGRTNVNGIQLNFGDATISRDTHALLVFDPGTRAFEIHDGGKKNPIAVNGDVLIGKRKMVPGDTVLIGVTTVRLDPA